MAVMRNFEAEAKAAVFHLFRHHASAAEAAAATEGETVTMSNLFAEAKTVLHDGLAKLESIDEAGVGVVEAARVNPTAVSIINTVASVAHLPDPDGVLAGLDNMLKIGASVLTHAAQATAPADGSVQPAQPTAAQPNVIR